MLKANKNFRSFFTDRDAPFDSRLQGYVGLPTKNATGALPKLVTTKQWGIAAINLVGLMNHENPLVYDSRKMVAARVAHANSARRKTKPVKTTEPQLGVDGGTFPEFARIPDYFELAGIDHLRKDNDLFVHTNGQVLRMLGALRATKNCMSCHDTKVGELLGALSYTLWPRK